MLILPGRAARGQRPNGPPILNRDSPQAQALASWWPLTEPGIVRDVVTGSIAALAPAVSVVGEPTLGLSQSNAYADPFASLGLPSIAPPWTAAVWFRRIAGSGAGVITAQLGTVDGLRAAQYGSPAENVGITAGGTNLYVGYSAPTTRAALLTWVQPASGDLMVYADGVSVGTMAAGGPSLHRGSIYNVDYIAHAYAALGWLGDLRMWTRAFTPSEVWALYDPATRWDLYWQRRRTFFIPAGGGGSFNPAWAAGSNVILGATPC